jgi:hypothetical protein
LAFWAIFFTNSSGHPGGEANISPTPSFSVMIQAIKLIERVIGMRLRYADRTRKCLRSTMEQALDVIKFWGLADLKQCLDFFNPRHPRAHLKKINSHLLLQDLPKFTQIVSFWFDEILSGNTDLPVSVALPCGTRPGKVGRQKLFLSNCKTKQNS